MPFLTPKTKRGTALVAVPLFAFYYLRAASIFILVLLDFICASGEKLS